MKANEGYMTEDCSAPISRPIPEGIINIGLAAIGLTVDYKRPTSFPFITLTIVFSFILVHLFGCCEAQRQWGIPSFSPLHVYGVGIFTHAFFHANLAHLVIEAYFFLLLGIVLEPRLGHRKFLCLFFFFLVSGVFCHSSFAHWWGRQSSGTYLYFIGSSAGISGLLVTCRAALLESQVELYSFRRKEWQRVRLERLDAIWILCQLTLPIWHSNGITLVSASSHLGGVLAALFASLVLGIRKSRDESVISAPRPSPTRER